MRNIKLYCVFWVSLLGAASVNADFNSAVKAYEQQEFAKAFDTFKRLGELGDVTSQRNLAAMYARGEYVEKDLVEAYAWATLAVEQAPMVANLRDAITSQMEPSAQEKAVLRAAELQDRYGVNALKKSLLPIANESVAICTVESTGDAIPVNTIPPRYPVNAARDGYIGGACFSFYLDVNGVPKRFVLTSSYAHRGRKDDDEREATNIGVLSGAEAEGRKGNGNKMFVSESRKALEKWRFKAPADELLRENIAHYCLDFTLAAASENETNNVSALVERVQNDANDDVALYELASKYRSLAFQWKTQDKDKYKTLKDGSQQLMLRSAIYGNSLAQYRVGSDLLTGDQCEKDPGKGVVWLTFAAQQGHAPSQYLLANQLLRGDGVQAQPEKAMAWYKAAADAGHNPAKLAFIRLALAKSDANVGELTAMLPQPINENDLMQLEIAAMMAARKGDFVRAQAFQKKVLEIADELQFDKDNRMQQLQKYAANQF